jgi:hypothetical protein
LLGMVAKQVSAGINDVPEAEIDHAQILIEVTESSKLLEEARQILSELGICIVDIKMFSADLVLLKLGTKDMRDAILRLSEKGFVAKGVNARAKKRRADDD